jgi:hypothetical protein
MPDASMRTLIIMPARDESRNVRNTLGVISMLLRRQLCEKCATLWFIMGIVTLILATFPQLLLRLSPALGVAGPSDLVFALVVVLLIGVALQLWQAKDGIRPSGEELAIRRVQSDDLEQRLQLLKGSAASVANSRDLGLDE